MKIEYLHASKYGNGAMVAERVPVTALTHSASASMPGRLVVGRAPC